MIKDLLKVLLVGGVVVTCLACAAKRPVLYPNAQPEAVGAEAAQRDIDDCLQKAAAAGYTTNRGGQVAGSTVVGAAAGSAIGAAVGAFGGGAGTGAAMGAAGGSAAGLIRGLFHSRDLNPVQRQFVNKCLQEKGYEVIGWQ
jgi:outer membrane lipoprotein SlyB